MDETGIAKVLDCAMEDGNVTAVIAEPTQLEITKRTTEAAAYYFVMNFRDEAAPLPGISWWEAGSAHRKTDRDRRADE